MFSFTNVLHIIIIFQGTILTLYTFLFARNKIKGNFLLATIIGTLTLQILGFFLTDWYPGVHFFQQVNCLYGFLYGPLLFFYNRSITRTSFQVTWRDWVHGIPAGIILICLILTRGAFCQPNIYIGYALHILTYIFLCLWEIHRYKKVVKDNYSKLELLNVRWLQWTFFMFTLIVAVDVIQFISFFLAYHSLPLQNIVYLFILAAINMLYVNGFMPSESMTGVSEEDITFSTSITTRKRVDMTLSENQELIRKLEHHLLSTHAYKNPNFTIGLLAQELGVPKRQLSELINDFYDQNFVDFINTYRINEAKERLMNPQNPKETILEVLYEVGFNSKSSFNSAFKKKTGLTPTQFKAQYP